MKEEKYKEEKYQVVVRDTTYLTSVMITMAQKMEAVENHMEAMEARLSTLLTTTAALPLNTATEETQQPAPQAPSDSEGFAPPPSQQ